MNSGPDPEAEVALLLCEVLLHVLVEQRAISREAAFSAIESVLELAREATEVKPAAGRDIYTTALIEKIAATFAAKDNRR
jgi:hypothetical protein